jgi:hypothetical protein
LSSQTIEDSRADRAPLTFRRIVVGVDFTGRTTNETGIFAVGLGHDGHDYVIADRSLLGTPEQWSTAVTVLYWELEANSIVAEKNFGGDMVEAAWMLLRGLCQTSWSPGRTSPSPPSELLRWPSRFLRVPQDGAVSCMECHCRISPIGKPLPPALTRPKLRIGILTHFVSNVSIRALDSRQLDT